MDLISSNIEFIALCAVLLPLLASMVTGFNTDRTTALFAQALTTGSLTISAVCSVIVFQYITNGNEAIHITLFNWFSTENFIANWGVFVDPLVAVMMIVVTSVSALVHLYSIGYMSHDEHKQRFMSYLSLFTFCMLFLVTADNFIQLFFGWEGVGLCSYLLIGFWFKKDSANAAAIKAFLVNRVGDFGFALGIFLLFWATGSVEFNEVFHRAPALQSMYLNFFGLEISVITMACLLLFMGAMGKSAQLGLHTWLPDAMEGPTPVSALIHAATMVTAGVFMVARCSPLFELSPVALSVVTVVGAITCIFAASIALVQNDIKKIIAYSTCSQLGYMFFACGVSAYSAAIFHLMTHAYFKALLFLGAGSVIHAMSNEQDIKKMGGIWKKIPFTYSTMWIGSLALAGIFPFAGFFSKDIILEAALLSPNTLGMFAYTCGILAAVFTAFYSWRLLILAFHGKTNASKEVLKHVHESPLTMTIPLFLLTVGAVFSGLVGENILHMVSYDHHFWHGSIQVSENNNILNKIHDLSLFEKILPLIIAVVGILFAALIYVWKTSLLNFIYSHTHRLYSILLNKWYFDEIYEYLLVRNAKKIGLFMWKKVDNIMIDGLPNGAAAISRTCARIVSRFQTGYIYHYAFVMVSALILIITIIITHL
jgi:NADH-quinone oxidoreductase subunit L